MENGADVRKRKPRRRNKNKKQAASLAVAPEAEAASPTAVAADEAASTMEPPVAAKEAAAPAVVAPGAESAPAVVAAKDEAAAPAVVAPEAEVPTTAVATDEAAAPAVVAPEDAPAAVAVNDAAAPAVVAAKGEPAVVAAKDATVIAVNDEAPPPAPRDEAASTTAPLAQPDSASNGDQEEDSEQPYSPSNAKKKRKKKKNNKAKPDETPVAAPSREQEEAPFVAPCRSPVAETKEQPPSSIHEAAVDRALLLVKEHWGLDARVSPLPSYDDENWLVECGDKYVLKIAKVNAACRGGADAASTARQLETENRMMAACQGQPFGAPSIVPPALVAIDGAFARLVTFCEGASRVTPQRLGAALGSMDAVLATLQGEEPRELAWDLYSAPATRQFASEIPEPRRQMALEALRQFDQLVASGALEKLPTQLIHGDCNDENILATPGRVSIIDFGDHARRPRIFEIAIALAYLKEAEDSAALVGAYHGVNPLEKAELSVLWTLVAARNAQTVLRAAHEAKTRDDPYVQVSVEQAWRSLEHVLATPRDTADAALYAACGFLKKQESAPVLPSSSPEESSVPPPQPTPPSPEQKQPPAVLPPQPQPAEKEEEEDPKAALLPQRSRQTRDRTPLYIAVASVGAAIALTLARRRS